MKIIKRNGSEVAFDSSKIAAAITKANNQVDDCYKLSTDQINLITSTVTTDCENMKHCPTVEEVQDLVEKYLHKSGSYEICKEYITYRYKRSIARARNTTDDQILTLIECNNEDIKQENSNKNPTINSTQRDYMAGEVSKDLTKRILLPKDVVDAHEAGIIHFHDADYFAQHMHNCFHSKTRFYTSEGVKQFSDFHDGARVQVIDCYGNFREATVHKYEPQYMYKITFCTNNREKEVICTRDHRWLLEDGSVTTHINVGDKLMHLSKLDISIDLNFMTPDMCKAFALGMVIGDGCDHMHSNCHQIRLCGDKLKYADILVAAGYRLAPIKNTDDFIATKRGCIKQDFLSNHGWRYMDALSKRYLFLGLYAADGAKNGNRLSTSDYRVIELVYDIAHTAGYYITSFHTEERRTNYKENAILTTIYFSVHQPLNMSWTVKSIVPFHSGTLYDTWCVEEPVTHSFMLEDGMITGNCDLVNLEDMLQNGTVISGTMIEKPHSFSTACNIATQIIAQVASSQYGGQSISLTHLAPFVQVSREKIRKTVEEEFKSIGVEMDEDKISTIVEKRVREEVKKGVQTIQYQVVTLMTTNGQAPFITVFMYLNEARNEQEKKDLAMIIEETLEQRYVGVKNEVGVYVTPAFPKLIYVLEDDNTYPGSRYYYLTKIAAKCTAKRLVPDYISEKKMKEYKLSKGETEGNGDVYTCMGCRSFLTPDRSGNGFDNIARAKNYEHNKPKYYGRLTA